MFALYRQGAGTCVFGLSNCPAFPNQAQVAAVLAEEFRKHIRPCSYNWWPVLDLDPAQETCIFDWQPPNDNDSWNVLQKRLKKGNSLARTARRL